MIFSHPKMEFEKVSNGWKVSIDVFPYRAHYIKLDGILKTPWMLDHVECIKDNMVDYLDMAFAEHLMMTGQRMWQQQEFIEQSG